MRARRRRWLLAAGLLTAGCTSIVGLPPLPAPPPDGGEPDEGGLDGNSPDAFSPIADADAGGLSQDSTVPDVGSTVSDACADGSCRDVISCPGSEVACHGVCVDLSSSADNCGRCDHGCGGGSATCMGSVCSPEALLTGIDAPTGFAIDSMSIYFAIADVLKSCPLTGCATSAKQIASLPFLSDVQIVNGDVTFAGESPSGYHAPTEVLACPVSGCTMPTPLQVVGFVYQFPETLAVGPDLYTVVRQQGYMNAAPSAELFRCTNVSAVATGDGGACAGSIEISSQMGMPIAADSNNVYFVGLESDAGPDGGEIAPTGIVSCSNGAPCISPSSVLENMVPSVMTIWAGLLYFVGPNMDLGTNTLYSCPVTGCTTPKPLNGTYRPITSLTADSSGLYFIAQQVGSATLTLFTCPLAGCGGVGPVALATGLASPEWLVTDPSFVYWVDQGTTADGGLVPGTASIQRIAKP